MTTTTQALGIDCICEDAKMCAIGKRVFLVILTNSVKDMTDKLRKKTHAKTHIKGIFACLKNTCLGCVLKVLLR